MNYAYGTHGPETINRGCTVGWALIISHEASANQLTSMFFLLERSTKARKVSGYPLPNWIITRVSAWQTPQCCKAPENILMKAS